MKAINLSRVEPYVHWTGIGFTQIPPQCVIGTYGDKTTTFPSFRGQFELISRRKLRLYRCVILHYQLGNILRIPWNWELHEPTGRRSNLSSHLSFSMEYMNGIARSRGNILHAHLCLASVISLRMRLADETNRINLFNTADK